MKKVVAVLLFFVLALSFAGCSKEIEETPENHDNGSISNAEIQEKDDASISDYDRETNDLFEKIYVEFEEEINNTVTEMYENLEELDEELNSYKKYIENTDKVEIFYSKILENTKKLCIKMYEYSVIYAESILESEESNDEKYSDLEVIYDNIYNDAGDEIYDLIYEDLFDDMYDLFYDGLLDNAYDNKEYSEYSEWLDAYSNEYDMWLDTRSDVYDVWIDTCSDIYDFWLDLSGEIWDDDVDRAYKIIEDFKEDIEELKRDIEELKRDIDGSYTSDNSDKAENTSSVSEEKTEESNDEYIDGMRLEFKEAMDSYEAFFDEYCEFMKKYKENPTDLSLMADYAEYMTKYVDVMTKLEKLGEDDLNDAELTYYIEVTNGITQKLLEVAY